jgi:hypothetical protein
MARKAAVMEVETEAVEDLAVSEDVVLIDEVPVAEVVIFEIDEDACRMRAYEISESEYAGSPEENWLRAEAEMRETLPA